jgi:hypothetical protein
MALVGECVETEPSSFEEAVQQPVWVDAMVEEYDSIIRNSVWDVVPRPQDKSVVSSRWLYKVKQAADGSVEKHKARFVARGFSQVEGIDYDETFAPVARYSSIRSMLALSAQMGWKIHQMDVKTAFLNGKIEEEVYIEQPEGFETFDRESHVCRLKRALYGLKQAPRAWYTRIDNYFTGLGFTKSEADANLYHIMVEGKPLIIVLYVDDLILTGDDQLIKSCKEDLAREFEMKDMGLMHYFLGMEVWQKDGEVFVSQGKYANEILRRFHMEKCKPMQTPLAGNWRKEDATSGEVVAATVYRQLVGSLMYLSEHTTRFVLCGEPAESSYGSAYQAVLEGSEACAEIPQRHISVWIMVQTDRGSEASGLHRCRLGRESIRPEEHFWRNLQPWFSCSFLVQQETEVSCT